MQSYDIAEAINEERDWRKRPERGEFLSRVKIVRVVRHSKTIASSFFFSVAPLLALSLPVVAIGKACPASLLCVCRCYYCTPPPPNQELSNAPPRLCHGHRGHHRRRGAGRAEGYRRARPASPGGAPTQASGGDAERVGGSEMVDRKRESASCPPPPGQNPEKFCWLLDGNRRWTTEPHP